MTLNQPTPRERATNHHNRTKRDADRQAFDAWFRAQVSDKEENHD